MRLRVPVRPALSPAARREVRDFAALLDARGADVAATPAPGTPGDLTDLTDLAELAARLRLPVRGPDPAFTTGLRERLLIEGVTVPRPRGTSPGAAGEARVAGSAPKVGRNRPRELRMPVRRGLRRPVGVVAAVLALLMVLVQASSGALPGDPLYSLKRTVEAARLSLSGSDGARGAVLLDEATTRLGELEALVAQPTPEGAATSVVEQRASEVDLALRDLQSQAVRGAQVLFGDASTGHRAADLATVSAFLTNAGPHLQAAAPRVPMSEAARMSGVLGSLSGIAAELADRLQACGAPCAAVPSPRASAWPSRSGAPPGGTPGAAAPSGAGSPLRGGPAPSGSAGVPGGGSAPIATSGAGVSVGAGGGGVGASVSVVPSAPAGASVGTGGASVGASLPGGGGVTVVVGPTPTVSVCVPVPLLKAC